ncbi:hypothetical protein B0J18DRAFT_167048 [Chaetomium sp. MPI-SDFR-AT-0129]|nr:hypothetical protein B0J18DRAFT_167048 [Chaetomium sp. MPI-SDFR-AT-0129]
MRSHIIFAGMASLMAPMASASTTCTSSNATPIEKYISDNGGGGSGGGGGGGGGFDVFLSYDPFAVLSNAVKHKRANTTPDARLANVANIILAPRDDGTGASATCADTEICLSVQTSPFCLDVTNGDFHDGQGTTGNALSGDYTLGDGRKGNLYRGPYPQPTAAGGGGSAAAQTTAVSGGDDSGDGSGNVSETAVPTPTPTPGTGAGTGGTGGGGASATQTGVAPAATTTKPNAGVSGQVDRMVMGGAAALLGVLLV